MVSVSFAKFSRWFRWRTTTNAQRSSVDAVDRDAARTELGGAPLSIRNFALFGGYDADR
jgi:hypothetical protein